MAKEALNASWESGRDLGIRQGLGNQAGIWESGRDSRAVHETQQRRNEGTGEGHGMGSMRLV